MARSFLVVRTGIELRLPAIVEQAFPKMNSCRWLSNKKALNQNGSRALSGPDGTRTRDLLRDRQAF